jgi:hypothetical protein
MTPKENAKELFDKIYNSNDYDGYCNGCGLVFEQAKDIALIAVNEIIAISSLTKIVYTESTNNSISEYTEHYYWQQVKEEINKL